MADTTTTETTKKPGQRKTLIGKVVSTKMAKTIVVEVRRQKAHPFYKRVVARSKRFYAHDEKGTARLGDFVQIEETRPLSKLKRWQLKEIVQRAAQVQGEAVAAVEEQKA
jgi:small subunit ribosomal protein S17